jgi:hypothetical protein
MEWYREEHNNLHLGGNDLRKVNNAGTAWDADYARVVNAALPFECCAVHAGGEGWGAESRSIADLQMRVYIADWSLKTVHTLIRRKALSKAKQIAYHQMGTAAKVRFRNDSMGKWYRTAIRFSVRHQDAVDEMRGGANIEFYVRSVGVETVVLVFMYADPCSQKDFIEAISSSFSHP